MAITKSMGSKQVPKPKEDTTKQTKNSDNDPHNLFVVQSYETGKYQLAEFKDQKFRTRKAFYFPLLKRYYEEHKMLCSCDGLILSKIDRDSHNIYVLWNPTTKAYKLFFSPYLVELFFKPYASIVNRKTTLGICYDESTDDYKVVFATKKYYAVYACKKNAWTEKKEFPYSGISEDPGLFVNGVLYWIGIERDKKCEMGCCHGKHHDGWFVDFGLEGNRISTGSLYAGQPEYGNYQSDHWYSHKIIYFDPIDNKFKEFHKPDGIDETNMLYLTTLKGCLCLYQNSYDRTKIRLWILEENSWTEFLTLENVPWPSDWVSCVLVKPLYLTTNNEVVFELRECIGISKFTTYNYGSKEYGKIRKFCIGWHSNIFTCMHSIVLPLTRNTRARNRMKPGKV